MGSPEAFLLFTRQVEVEMRSYARDLISYVWDTESLGNKYRDSEAQHPWKLTAGQKSMA